MIFRYLLATAAIAFAGAVACFAAVVFAGAAAAFAAPAPQTEMTAPAGSPPGAEAMRTKLKDMDTDHDGRWSKAEWIAGGRREKGFDRMDTNHDGYLTPDELKTGMAAMRASRAADMPMPPPAPAENN